jgi:hypothetical protein
MFLDSISEHDHLLGSCVHCFPLILHLLAAVFDSNLEIVKTVEELLNKRGKTLVVFDIWNDLTKCLINRLFSTIDISHFEDVVVVFAENVGAEVCVKDFAP